MAGLVKSPQYQKKGTAIFQRGYAAGTVSSGGAFQIATATVFNDSDSISIASATQIVCKAGKKYSIRAEIHIDAASADYIVCQIYNVTTSAYIGGESVILPANSTLSAGNTTISEAIIAPSVDTTLEFRSKGIGTTAYYRAVIKVYEVEALLSETLGQTNFTDANMSGFTRLGESAPAIKMKKLTGTTASTEGGTTSVTHGLTASKIISFTGAIYVDATTVMPFGYKPGTAGNQGFEVHCYVSNTGFSVINHATNSENILSKPFAITIFYEE
jgi:hypothetical protein